MVRAVRLVLTAAVGLSGCATPAPTPTEVERDVVVSAPPDGLAIPDGARPTGGECAAPAVASPRWWHDAVGYEIFVRSFQDSDGDGVGDLAGLTARLDYLNDGDAGTDDDLGVDLLWLMPIAESPSYHGYDVTNYRAVEQDYGTDADLSALMAAAQARGIRVIADLVLNHSSSQHPWFVDAMSSGASTHRDWYVWSDTCKDWSRPWGPGTTWHRAGGGCYYALFWEGMPDLNYATPAVRAEMIDVAKAWLGRGMAGFRLDAARYLIETGGGAGQADTAETHAYWKEFSAAARAAKADALLVGEVWTDTAVVATYFGTPEAPELGMAFDFDSAAGILASIGQGREAPARVALCNRLEGFPAHGSAGTFLTNHDQRRVASELKAAGDAGLRLAAFALLTWPGTPWLYYGEELGMSNGSGSGDEDKRLPMQWSAGAGAGFTTGTPWRAPQSEAAEDSVAGQTGDAGSLLSWYRSLIRLRRELPVLRRGATARVEASGTAGEPLVLRRSLPTGERALLVHSFAGEANTVTIPADALDGATAWTDRLTGDDYAADDSGVAFELERYGAALLVPGS